MFSPDILRIYIPAKANGLKLACQRLVKVLITHSQKDTGREIDSPAVFHGLSA
jgi:hypothetical protein